MARIIKPQDREAWLEVRGGGIGSSDVATLLGLNPYDSPYMLYLRKRGLEPPKEENNLMRLGHSLEWAIAAHFESETNRGIIGTSVGDWMYQHDTKPYLMASPDRLYWIDHEGKKSGKRADDNKAILECKSTQKRIDPDNIPQYWFCQLQWQLGISGLKQGSIAWLTQGRDFGFVDVSFNPDFFAYMEEEATRFWLDNVQRGIEPELTTSTDVVSKFFASTPDKSIRADQETEERIQKLIGLKAQANDLETQIQAIELEIKAQMQDAERIIGLDGETLVSWRTSKGASRIDTKALRAAHPDICAQFTKQSEATRRFVIK